MTLALSGMVLNHLVLPLYQPPAQGNIYRWLKWTRRLLIVAIIMASYAFYLLLGAEQDLSNLGIVSFVATLPFPAPSRCCTGRPPTAVASSPG